MTVSPPADTARMTPPTIRRVNAGKGHRYEINGRQVPGVTTIINDGYPKPALIQWAANETARAAVELAPGELADLGPIKGYEQLRYARYRTNKAAQIRGTQVHDLAEQLSHGQEVEVPPELGPYVDSAIKFLDDLEVKPIRTEQVVASTRYGYCGTFDLYATTNRGLVLIDYKTSTGDPYPETALQLAAYAHAEWWLNPDGTTIAVYPENVRTGAVVQLGTDGYTVTPCDISLPVFRAFLHCKEVADYRNGPSPYQPALRNGPAQ